ncbi:FAD-binding protein [Heyndrickxia coagulans]|uniref:FAD-binding protein n=1 Tax=Heyndrickxia coagulans TaxID=1398 RepID=UPI00399D4E1A
MKFDVIVVGAGLAGLVATAEMADAGKKVLLLDQEPENSMGGQAWWSFGGLFLVDSPEQRRLGIKDSRELAWQDWLGTVGFDREDDEDYWEGNGLKLTSILLPEKTWFILTQKIIEKEFALSGSEQNPDLTGKSIRKVLGRALPGAPEPVQAFMDKGEDFIIAHNLEDLVDGMNRLTGESRLNFKEIEYQIKARDREWIINLQKICR